MGSAEIRRALHGPTTLRIYINADLFQVDEKAYLEKVKEHTVDGVVDYIKVTEWVESTGVIIYG